MVKQVWRREFNLQVFRLEHQKAEDFLLCQWQTRHSVHVGYVLYRWLLSCFFVITLFCSACSISTDRICNAKWLIYMTNWGYLVYTLQAIVSTWFLTSKLITASKGGGDTRTEPMKTVYKVFWALHTVGMVAAYCVSMVYWVTIYDPKLNQLDTVNLLGHAINSVVMTLDLFMVRHPVHLLHAYLPLSFTVVYILFSMVYYFAGGTSRQGNKYIYTILDWERPTRTIICCIIGLVFLSAVHMAVWALHLLRGWLYRTLVCRGAKVEPCANPSTSSAL